MSDKELIQQVLNNKALIENLTEEQISQKAIDYVNGNKDFLKTITFKHNTKDKRLIFTAGSPGAGKSELAEELTKQLKIDTVEADNIRKYCPHYNGHNSHLFQRASSKAVDILVSYAFKNDLSFILDGNFAHYPIQKQNIERALKRDYEVEIRFVSIDIEEARRYTKVRERTEGRRITDEVFHNKFLKSVETVKKFFSVVKISLYDLTNNNIIENISEEEFDKAMKNNLDKINKTILP